MNIVVWLTLGLIIARLAAELWLAALNRRHVLAHAGEIPPAFQGIIDEPTYKKSVAYTLLGRAVEHARLSTLLFEHPAKAGC